MNLFGKKTSNPKVYNTKIKTIKILGPGCPNCIALEKATQKALAQLGWSIKLEHVTDVVAITNYGVLSTPALMVNQEILSAGQVLTSQQVKELLVKFEGEADV